MEDRTSKALQENWVKNLLSQPLLARLGTVNLESGQPHVTPVWFEWDGEAIYISVFASTRKGREVTRNTKISVLIDTDKPTQAVLMEGPAEILSNHDQVGPRSESIYAKYVGAEEVKKDPYQSWAGDPENRIIKLVPTQVYTWSW